MANEITPMQAIQDNIRDKIKAEFVNMIPDEMWAGMVKSVVDEFSSDRVDSYDRSKKHPSDLKKLIQSSIETEAKKAIDAELKALGSGTWEDNGKLVVGEALKNLVSRHFNEMLAGMQMQMVEMATYQALQAMRQKMGGY